MPPTATVAIPTRSRARYLETALASIAPQAAAAAGEVLVVADGPDPATEATAARHGARLLVLPARSGANAARNAAVAASQSDLIVFVDDDVEAPPGWLAAILTGAEADPGAEVFGGPITPRLDGGGPRACGHEPAPITSLDLGPADRDAAAVWSANMAVRRSAADRLGPFDPAIHGRGEEEEWQERYRAGGGRIRYLAGAGLVHRRAGADASLRRLSLAAYRLGRSARRNDVRKGQAPSAAAEFRGLLGGLWHAAGRRCGFGLVFAAHAVGRLQETLAGPGGPR